MKQFGISCVIVAYLSALGWGVLSHTLMVGNVAHPVMYFLVWDMFCGWAGYETRQHLIAEGESGAHYALTPAPWGEFQPFGPAWRPDYDAFGVHSVQIARNVLANTEHEPIRRIYLVEENWSKRYNRPDALWALEFEEPKEQLSYYHRRATYDGNGTPLEIQNNWAMNVFHRELASDPRLARLQQSSRPFFALSAPSFTQPAPDSGSAIQQTSFTIPGN